ncbi:hypothetical protein DPMN_034501 [Dreissena polymorpha]|uniref:Uncharacterized protein n=1 Tax=Dreissena polymorpha TaxID=45954 RepID=A0A9D4RK54_DREPO|nr:hypothetical protein DPMN_034501 [Dreissena polymorpha]
MQFVQSRPEKCHRHGCPDKTCFEADNPIYILQKTKGYLRCVGIEIFDIITTKQASIQFHHSNLHRPMRHSETGSPTAMTNDWARVMAVFRSLMLDRNPRSSLSVAAASVEQVWRVLTVLITITRNCLPAAEVNQ